MQTEVRGPAIGDIAMTFWERWNDRTPLDRRTPFNRMRAAFGRQPDAPSRSARWTPTRPRPVAHRVQVLRTYPYKTPEHPFAPHGERSIAREYHKAFARARRLVYVEDQYLWSAEVGELYEEALRTQSRPAGDLGRAARARPQRHVQRTGAPDRAARGHAPRHARPAATACAVYDLENEAGTPIYVHAKVVIVDDVLAAVGSDNMNRRSWTHDSELSLAVLDEAHDDREPADPAGLGDGARSFARRLRLELMREHLQVSGDEGLLEPLEAFDAFARSAAALEAWHRGGGVGARPAGRLRPHHLRELHPWEVWATPLYRTLIDPDGRPRDLRRAERVLSPAQPHPPLKPRPPGAETSPTTAPPEDQCAPPSRTGC